LNTLFNLWPYVGQALLLAVLITVMPGRFVKDSRVRIGIIAALLALCLFLPVSGLSIAQWLRSVLGDLSVFTLVLFLNFLAQRFFKRNFINPESRRKLLLGIAVAGAAFYPLALGVSSFDPYHLGYSPIFMASLLCLASIVSWVRARHDLAIILLLPLLAYNFGMYESSNLWDYLLDPVLLIYAVVQCMATCNFLVFKKMGGQRE
jgi:hypothetical protein